MSYILDALKKAESERNLGAVPGVHATTLDGGSQADASSAWRKYLPWVLVIVMALGLLAYVAWSHTSNKTEQMPPAVAKAAESTGTPPGVAPQAEPAPAALPEPQANPVQPVAVKAPVVSPNQAGEKPVVAEKKAAEKPANAASVSPSVSPSAKSKPAPTTIAKTPAPSPEVAKTDEQSVGTAQDLPLNIQRELPQISVNGYIYAKNPEDRSVLINRKLLHEGESIAPDLVLEKMIPKGAILNYKGYRYRVTF